MYSVLLLQYVIAVVVVYYYKLYNVNSDVTHISWTKIITYNIVIVYTLMVNVKRQSLKCTIW